MSKPDYIPQEVWEAAFSALDGEDVFSDFYSSERDKRIHISVALAIMAARDAEQGRCLDICAAEREWGDFHPDDVMGKIARGEQARVIPGWNAPYEDSE